MEEAFTCACFSVARSRGALLREESILRWHQTGLNVFTGRESGQTEVVEILIRNRTPLETRMVTVEPVLAALSGQPSTTADGPCQDHEVRCSVPRIGACAIPLSTNGGMRFSDARTQHRLQ